MHLARRVLGLSAAALLLPMTGAAHAAEPLAAETVLRGAQAGVVQIELNRNTTLLRDAVKVEGDGEFAAFALVAEGTSLSRTVIVGGRSKTKSLGDQTFVQGVEGDPGTDLPVPAGRYRLYLLADEPAEIRLKFDGLAGTSVLRPARTAAFKLQEPARQFLPQGFYGAGGAVDMAGSGLMIGVVANRYSAAAGEINDYCHHFGSTATSPLAYAPGCPGRAASNISVVSYGGVAPAGNLYTALAVTSQGGLWGQGFAGYGVGVQERLDFHAGWLTFDDEPWDAASGSASATPPSPPGRH